MRPYSRTSRHTTCNGIKDGVATIVFQHEHEEFVQALRARGVLPSTS
jgi:hypothetical protein